MLTHVREGHRAGGPEPEVHPAELQMLTLDLAVHAWDLARSQGRWPIEDEELYELLHRAFAPHTALMAQEQAFAPPLDAGPGAGALDRLVALCGRDPSWRPPRA